MTENEIKARVHEVIRRWAPSLPRAAVLTPEADLHGDLGLKVLDTLQVVMDVEDSFEGVVYVTDEEAEAIRTVGDVERLVLEKVRHPERQPA